MALDHDFLSQLAEYLEAQGVGYTAAVTGHPVNIFVNKQPGDPDNCITLLGNLGNPPNATIPDLMFPRFQIIVRNTDYAAASTKMREVRAALHDKIAVSLTNFFVFYIKADQEGFPIGEDDAGRAEFSINFSAETRYGDSI